MESPTAESEPVIKLTARPTTEEAPEVVSEELTESWSRPAPRIESYTSCPNGCDAPMLYGYGCDDCGLSDPR